jgi:hypothetical protein
MHICTWMHKRAVRPGGCPTQRSSSPERWTWPPRGAPPITTPDPPFEQFPYAFSLVCFMISLPSLLLLPPAFGGSRRPRLRALYVPPPLLLGPRAMLRAPQMNDPI